MGGWHVGKALSKSHMCAPTVLFSGAFPHRSLSTLERTIALCRHPLPAHSDGLATHDVSESPPRTQPCRTPEAVCKPSHNKPRGAKQTHEGGRGAACGRPYLQRPPLPGWRHRWRLAPHACGCRHRGRRCAGRHRRAAACQLYPMPERRRRGRRWNAILRLPAAQARVLQEAVVQRMRISHATCPFDTCDHEGTLACSSTEGDSSWGGCVSSSIRSAPQGELRPLNARASGCEGFPCLITCHPACAGLAIPEQQRSPEPQFASASSRFDTTSVLLPGAHLALQISLRGVP